MTTIIVSSQKLQEILHVLRDTQRGNAGSLGAVLPTLIACIESLRNLHLLLANGCGIVDIRKLFGLISSRRACEDKKDESVAVDQTDLASPAETLESPATEIIEEQLGLVPTSIGTADLENPKISLDHSTAEPASNRNKNHEGKAGVDDYPDAERCEHHHAYLKSGDLCPECGKGKIYPTRPRQQILFEGSAPIKPVAHISFDLRCNICDEVFRAEPSESAKKDGLGTEDRFGHSAVSMIGIMKYFSALPLYRNHRLHGLFGVNLSPSSQFDQSEKLANALRSVDMLSHKLSAQAPLFLGDDATAKIIAKPMDILPERSTGKLKVRDGCHSSVIIAFDKAGHPLVRIRTDIIHAGEWMDKILGNRLENLPPPIVMWDRCSTNSVTVTPIIDVACNQHARQGFKECQKDAPKLINPILEAFKRIFFNDAQTINMTPAERLAYHQKNSQPVFDFIENQCHSILENKLATPASNFGKSCQYILNHEQELRGFLHHESAPVSNNLAERIILYLVLLRNNAYFFKTVAGARVADTILSVGLSAFLIGVNIFHYFRLILAEEKDVKKNPEDWLPWNFYDRFPEYTLAYPDRSRSWPPNRHDPTIPLMPPK
jgi:hypothetical protein